MPLCLQAVVVMEKTQKCLAREVVSAAWEWNESRCFLLCDRVRGPLGATSEELLKSVILRVPVPPRGVQVWNQTSATISACGARKCCKSQNMFIILKNKAIVLFCFFFFRLGSWLNCLLVKPESWMDGFTTARPSEAARWRTCVRISSVTDTTTRAKTMSPQGSLGNNSSVLLHLPWHKCITTHNEFSTSQSLFFFRYF